MNEVIKAIKERRSVKSYKSTPVPNELVDAIAEAGTYAPTGRNMQSPVIIKVTDRKLRDRIAELNAKVAGMSGDPFYGAPAVLVVLADRSAVTYVYDGSVVMENLMLAAHSLGLGSCWIHRAKEVFDSPEGKEILASLGIEGDYEGIGNCIIGYTDVEPAERKPRKENYIYNA